MQDRVDEIDKYYKSIVGCDWWISRIFWVCVFTSIIVPYSNKIPATFSFLQQIPGIVFIVLVVAYSAIWIYRGFHLIPVAERMRRKELLSNSFDVPLVYEKTVNYYNNPLAPSIGRLGASILENSHFAKNVCHEMAKIERRKILIYTLAWVAAIACRTTDLSIILSITQVIFGGEIIIHWIKLEALRSRNEQIFDELYNHFFHRISPKTNPGIAGILDSFASYEAAKEAFGISQSSKIFHKLNTRLSTEWDEIREKLGIDEMGYDQTENSKY